MYVVIHVCLHGSALRVFLLLYIGAEYSQILVPCAPRLTVRESSHLPTEKTTSLSDIMCTRRVVLKMWN
ncbi:hypothetical protein GBAR_LOCUS12746 [Geodia barretti]|uniref:Uncharacterized protein n=1 Tax=Geodia barretti TaxID=519541 RepID=A0AA35S403_GEOBA|nr:hypothetical protein GBAR_LOCUS12746 [Geodia barretti]